MPAMATADNLGPADQTLPPAGTCRAPVFDGREAFYLAGEMMAKVAAAHFADQLRLAGFVVMQRPAAAHHHTAPSTGPDGGSVRSGH